MPEDVIKLDEKDILGYFETIECNFIVKLALLFSALDEDGKIEPRTITGDVRTQLLQKFNCTMVLKSLDRRNEEPVKNLLEDATNTLFLQSWIVLELVVKDLIHPDYSLNPGDYTCTYNAGSFGLSKAEKDDLDLFYYMRNAMVHCNGAYNASKQIDHMFNGERFKSVGAEGFAGEMRPDTAFKMHKRIQDLTLKAWGNHTKRKPRP